MFEEFFGEISPVLIATMISGLAQLVKQAVPQLEDRWIKVGVFVANLIFVIPFYLSLQADVTWVEWFKAIFYGFSLGIWSTGFWATFIRPTEVKRGET